MTQLEHLGPYYSRHVLLGQQLPLPVGEPIVEHPELLQVAQGDSLAAAIWELRWRRNCWIEPCARFFAVGGPGPPCCGVLPLLVPGAKAGSGGARKRSSL